MKKKKHRKKKKKSGRTKSYLGFVCESILKGGGQERKKKF